MYIPLIILFGLLVGCTKVSDADLKSKIDACSAAGMNFTYLDDWRGNHYDVMCVAKRLR